MLPVWITPLSVEVNKQSALFGFQPWPLCSVVFYFTLQNNNCLSGKWISVIIYPAANLLKRFLGAIRGVSSEPKASSGQRSGDFCHFLSPPFLPVQPSSTGLPTHLLPRRYAGFQLPDQGLNACLLQWKCNGPPGKSQKWSLFAWGIVDSDVYEWVSPGRPIVKTDKHCRLLFPASESHLPSMTSCVPK